MTPRFLLVFLACLLVSAGCGSSSSGGGSSTVSVSVTPATVSVNAGQTQNFTATISGSSNTAVTWSVQEGAAGGTVNASGAYTAPNASGIFHVVATSQADNSKSATATVTVNPAMPSITSTAPSNASEGMTYSYPVTASDPAGGTVTLALVNAPAGAALNGNTIAWTPSEQQARVPNTFNLRATSPSGGTTTQTWTVSPSGTVRGTWIDIYHTALAQGTVSEPADLSGTGIAALVPNGSGFTEITGVGKADGTFEIPNVPAGFFWLRATPTGFLWTDRSSFDLGDDVQGRPDSQVASPGTTITFNVSNANEIADDVFFYSVPSTRFSTFRQLAPDPLIGSTTYSSVVPWNGRGLQDAGAGDVGYLGQQEVSDPSGMGVGVEVLNKILTTNLTLNNGGDTQVNGAFADVPLTTSMHIQVSQSSYDAYKDSMSPNTTLQGAGFLVGVNPGGADAFFSPSPLFQGGSTSRIILDGLVRVREGDADLGNISYGNPFPSSFQPYVGYVYYRSRSVLAPGTTMPAPYVAHIATYDLPDAPQPLLPAVSPVKNPKINGLDLFVDNAGVGLTPTVSWNVPQQGSATAYQVAINRLQKSSADPNRTTLGIAVASFVTTETSVTVLPGLLTSGESYVCTITAILAPNVDLLSATRRVKLPYARAQALSGTFQP